MTKKYFDVSVLGLGTMGAFACLEIARRKASVIGFDRFAPPHNRGSHSGDTRVFREAYAEHPDYVPLARRAGELWDRFGDEAGTVFLHRCGMLNIGTEDSCLIAGIRASAAMHSLKVEELSIGETAARFAAFAPPPDSLGILERAAGWLMLMLP
jgi:sarcosine oxidase